MTTEQAAALAKQFAYVDINTDVLAGFEARMRSAKARAPEHLTGQRWSDWTAGHKAADLYLSTRRTVFSAERPDGTKLEVVRKGWVARGPVVSQLARSGATGDVYVTYTDGSKLDNTRIVTCGI